jgi:hypothetical protein
MNDTILLESIVYRSFIHFKIKLSYRINVLIHVLPLEIQKNLGKDNMLY